MHYRYTPPFHLFFPLSPLIKDIRTLLRTCASVFKFDFSDPRICSFQPRWIKFDREIDLNEVFLLMTVSSLVDIWLKYVSKYTLNFLII